MLTEKRVWEIAISYQAAVEVMVEMEFSNRRHPPKIKFFNDENSFYDFTENLIHIGIKIIATYFKPETKEEVILYIEYLVGHECEHVHSTAKEPYYKVGVDGGAKRVLEHIMRELGLKYRFRTDASYKAFADTELPKHGILFSYDLLRKTTTFVTNSLEDGRTEGIRSNREPGGFAKNCKVARGKDWMNCALPAPDDTENNPILVLRVILDNVLSLATCQMYARGFLLKYKGTPLEDAVKDCVPHISKAISAKLTREMAQQAQEICIILAPYIYDACKQAGADEAAKELLNELLKELLEKLISSGSEQGGTSEKDEEEGDGVMPMTFASSDLADDTEDGSDGSGTEQTEAEEKESEAGENTSEAQKNDDTEDGSGSEQTGAEEKESEAQKNDEASGKGAKKEKENENNEETTAGASGDESDEADDEAENNSEENKEELSLNTSPMENKQRKDPENISEASDSIEKAVKDAMEKAASEIRKATKETLEMIVASKQRTLKRKAAQVAEDVSKDVTADMQDIYRGFCEEKRSYKVDTPLPAVIEKRGSTLRNAVKDFFIKRRKRVVHGQTAGAIDSARLHTLAYGETEVFRRHGSDRKNRKGKISDKYVAYMLIDNSGSMYGSKKELACGAAAVIEEGFKESIPLKIVAFDTQGPVIHEVIKGFEERLAQNCCWNYYTYSRNGGGNEDGYDIMIATRELLARKEKKKMLVILSDGAPGDCNLVRNAVRNARARGIKVCSIYFEEGYVTYNKTFEYMYEQDFICCPANEIDGNLIDIFQNFLRSNK